MNHGEFHNLIIASFNAELAEIQTQFYTFAFSETEINLLNREIEIHSANYTNRLNIIFNDIEYQIIEDETLTDDEKHYLRNFLLTNSQDLRTFINLQHEAMINTIVFRRRP